MSENLPWITAWITAYARAYHSTHDSPAIFDDFLADRYFTPEEHIRFDQTLAGMLEEIDPELADSSSTDLRPGRFHQGEPGRQVVSIKVRSRAAEFF